MSLPPPIPPAEADLIFAVSLAIVTAIKAGMPEKRAFALARNAVDGAESELRAALATKVEG